MFNRYRRCCCQNNYNPDVIETLCSDVGTTAEYATQSNVTNGCGCGCGMNVMNSYSNSCSCGFDEEESVFPENPMLAQSYVPMQQMDKSFTPACGLKMATIFPELVSPYRPSQDMVEIEYLKNTNEIGEGCNQ